MDSLTGDITYDGHLYNDLNTYFKWLMMEVWLQLFCLFNFY